MSGDKSKNIAFSYFGGKFTIVDKLYAYFPDHVHFIDVFMGSMVVTLNKKTSDIETVNDINSDIVNFFKVLRNQPDQLISHLKLTPVSRFEFNESWTMDNCSELEKARRFYVRIRQSFCSMGAQKKNKGWHMCKTQSRSNVSEIVNKWHNGIEKLLPVIDRLTHIQIENKDFRELIRTIDFDGAFFYCDPPYPMDVRNSTNDYRFEFNTKDHEDLSELLHSIKGKAMKSGYDGPTMQNLYKDWHQIKFPIKNNNIRHGPVQECIWMNYNPNLIYKNLFENEL